LGNCFHHLLSKALEFLVELLSALSFRLLLLKLVFIAIPEFSLPDFLFRLIEHLLPHDRTAHPKAGIKRAIA
jgi:hypothetical protein